MNLDLDGRVAVVTGAGIGLAITTALAGESAHVVAGSRRTDTLEGLERVTGVATDLTAASMPSHPATHRELRPRRRACGRALTPSASTRSFASCTTRTARRRARSLFDQIEPELYRFPAIDPASFRARVERELI